jgi:hypothetical protein
MLGAVLVKRKMEKPLAFLVEIGDTSRPIGEPICQIVNQLKKESVKIRSKTPSIITASG